MSTIWGASARLDPEEIETRYLHDFVNFAGTRVLEVGVGEGRLTWRYADAAREVVGIDPLVTRIVAANLERSGALRTNINLVGALAGELPFKPTVFDVALLSWSL
jgi:ubiquinone/menaquinone biosynthesis C-methylase UbiE